MSYIVAVDIGGTFTDLVAFDHATNQVLYTKSPTTYGNFVDGIIDCFAKARSSPRDAALVNHGTTLVINALIQRHGAKAALVTTRRLSRRARDRARQPARSVRSALSPRRAARFRANCASRCASASMRKGDDHRAARYRGADRTRRRSSRAAAVEAVAMFFLNSYANPQHEGEAAAAAARVCLPDVFVTHSTELTREWYEYERTLDGRRQRLCRAAGEHLHPPPRRRSASRDGFDGTLYMMGSNGGVLVGRAHLPPADRAGRDRADRRLHRRRRLRRGAGLRQRRSPSTWAARPPSARWSRTGGSRSIRSTTPAAMSRAFRSSRRSSTSSRSAPAAARSPGSIAQQRLHVGPQSAGSTPGPVCYGRGGTEPTVTDANLVLGRLNAEHFLGGELALDVDAARRAIAERIAAPLGYTDDDGVVRMADGILVDRDGR